MKFTFIGTGSAFTMQNKQASILIEHNDKRLLIDAGADTRFSLADVGLSYKDLGAVYVTHLHSDHTGGLEYLAFTSYFDPSFEDKISLFGNGSLLNELWDNTLKGGLKSIQGKRTTLEDFFDVHKVKRNGNFVWEGITFQPVQTVHIMDEYSIVSSYGLMITAPNGKKIFYTSDTQFNPNQIRDFYAQADAIIQDCETLPFCTGVHANYTELETLNEDVKRKMCFVHFQDNVLAALDEWRSRALNDGFSKINFVEKGATFTVAELIA
jgi:ribonuclease BN (tRNA processing enzyme)